jgi:hypothetical protein
MLLAVGAIAIPALWSRPVAAADDLNACGCREGAPGQCVCEKKSRCGCPGECEPRGCDERRAKQLEKEIQAETRKAEESSRRQRAHAGDSDDNPSGGDDNGRGNDQASPPNNSPKNPPPKNAPPKVRIVKMTPAQRRDLARLIGAYLAEHPEQGSRSIDQVQTEMRQK